MSKSESTDTPASKDNNVVALKRGVGLLGGVAMIVGSCVGSGIFISPQGTLRETGSVGMSLIIWVFCAIIAMCGALSYAELGAMLPSSGGEHAYLLHVFGDLPSYLFAWTFTVIIKPCILSIISLVCGIYIVAALGIEECGNGSGLVWAQKLFAGVVLLLLLAINCLSVKLATRVQIVFTFTKLAAMAIIVVIGFINMVQGKTEHLSVSTSFEGSATNFFAYSIAIYQGNWAYDSWNQLNFITEELKNPSRNLPVAIAIAMPLVAVCYLLVNIAYFTVLSPEEMLASPAVAVTFADQTLGVMAWIMPVAVCCSTFGAANGHMFASGRLPYAAARSGHLPKILSYIQINNLTPFYALCLSTCIALLLLIPGDFNTLINYYGFATWFFYGLTVVALLVLRGTHPEYPRPFKVPLVFPIFFILCSVYLIIAPIINDPALEFLYAFLFIMGGLIFYIPFIHFKWKLGCMDPVTRVLQKLAKVVPSSKPIN